MADVEKQLDNLQQQIHAYKQRQIQMFKELQDMERDLALLKAQATGEAQSSPLSSIAAQSSPLSGIASINERQPAPLIVTQAPIEPQPIPYIKQAQQNVRSQSPQVKAKASRGLEDFIGTNLISKIGILITIIGVFIGAKYAIDNELISASMRIVIGYVAGAALIGTALKLKDKYNYFSSVLMGGGVAIVYFITYIAFSFYQLMPQSVAFAGMLVTTIATVLIALWYNQKIIAIIGQVGAYAIPFLLSDGSGKVFVLFSYISIINVGLVVLSFAKDWKILYRIGFSISWLIYAVWIAANNFTTISFAASLIFLAINFITFYAMFLSYKVFRRDVFNLPEVLILLLNALFFFFLGFYFISANNPAVHTLTWFTLANALIHAVVGYVVYRIRLFDASVVQFVVALALLFITIAIPIELDGNWVTLLWTIEGTLLCMVAYKYNRSLYLQIAMPVLVIAVLSLVQDWSEPYQYLGGSKGLGAFSAVPFSNLNFWTSMVVAVLFGWISYKHALVKPEMKEGYTSLFFQKLLPLVFLAMVYFNFFLQIHYAFDKAIAAEGMGSISAMNIVFINNITLTIYTAVFVSIVLVVNARMVKRFELHYLFLVFAMLTSAVVLLSGLYHVGRLRENYLDQHHPLNTMFLLRYALIAGLIVLWMSAVYATRKFPLSGVGVRALSIVFNITLLAVLCSEFIHWMDIAGYSNQYKLGLTIIWGMYALSMLVAGIGRKKKHLRLGAMVLFGATILKLFIYDLASLSTISKTIVLVILGVLLLISSFLYNKYKELLFDAPLSEEPAEG